MMTRTIRTVVAIAALLIATIAAQAADLPRPSYKAPPYSEPSYANWTGFYIGLNGGYAWADSNWSGSAGDFKVSPKGWLLGGTAGYNYQTGTWVWGIEGDIDYANLKGTADICGGCTVKDTWLGTARLRVGYAGWNNWLPYLTGGGAFGNLKASTPLGDTSNTRWGWTAGAGIEWAFKPAWSLKAEYMHVDLGSTTTRVLFPVAPINFIDYRFQHAYDVARVGINYKWGGGPVVAKY